MSNTWKFQVQYSNEFSSIHSTSICRTLLKSMPNCFSIVRLTKHKMAPLSRKSILQNTKFQMGLNLVNRVDGAAISNLI